MSIVELGSKKGEIISRRLLGIRRLDSILVLDRENDDEKLEVVRYILGVYGFDEEDMGELGLQQRFDMAMRETTQDLLFTNFYNEWGDASVYGKAWLKKYPKMKAEEYRYIGNKETVFDLLNRFVRENNRPISYQVQKYNEMFGKEDPNNPPFLILPGKLLIDLDEARLKDFSQEDFIPPYGEGRVENVTVFKNSFHKLGRK